MAKKQTSLNDEEKKIEDSMPGDDAGFKNDSGSEEDAVSPDAILTERERILRNELSELRNKQGSLISQLQRELSEVRKKTGVRARQVVGTEEDGLAKVATDHTGKLLTSWRMKIGTGVEIMPDGRLVDTQTVQFVNEDGVETELPYRQFYRMISANKVPCRIKGYLKRDSNGFLRAVKQYRPDELVKIILGHYDGNPEDGVMVYDGPEMKIAYRFLNP